MWRKLVLEPVPWAQVRHTTRKPRRGPTMAAAFHPRGGMSCSRHARCRTLGAGRAARPLDCGSARPARSEHEYATRKSRARDTSGPQPGQGFWSARSGI